MSLSDHHFDVWLGKPAPRYTSYPPATQFKPIEAEEDAPHLAALAQTETPISLYIHIPFCRSLCLFCGCHTHITTREDVATAYLAALHAEIDIIRRKIGKNLKVAHLHFGGGSPSTLTPNQFKTLMRHLRTHFNFLPTAEKAIELDPRTTTEEFILALAHEGINRVSLGVQDIDQNVQEAIHRLQPYELVQKIVLQLRNAGISAISFDLMYGLPLQTTKGVESTVDQVLALQPNRISLFAYAHVPSMKVYQKKLEQYGLPNDRERLEMEQAARNILEKNGFVSIGMDHFAKPDDPLSIAQRDGRLSRNFQGYTDDSASLMLGLGASSISDVGTMMVQNEPSIGAYEEKLKQNTLPLKRVCLRTADDQRRAHIIRDLMCLYRAEIPDDLKPNDEAMAPFLQAGLARWEDNILVIDTTYRMVARLIATLFDATYNPALVASKTS